MLKVSKESNAIYHDQYLGYTWIKVFSHHVDGGMFGYDDRINEPNNWNADDPDALRYSILYRMEKYRKNGVFHLRICFPDYTEDEFPCNEWEQSSNFVHEKEITGFKAIRLTYPKCWGDKDFVGLYKDVTTYWTVTCYSWYFSFGMTTLWGRTWEGAPGKRWIPETTVWIAAG